MHIRVCATRREKRDEAKDRKRESKTEGERERERKLVCPREFVVERRALVCVPCSECTEQALLVRGHLSYDRSVPTLPVRLPASCLPACLPAYLSTYLPALPPSSTDCPLLLHPSTFTAAILPLAEPVGFSGFKVGTHTTQTTVIRGGDVCGQCRI